MSFPQLNFNYCETAQDLLIQTTTNNKIDAAILPEQYRNLGNESWISDGMSRAIWIPRVHHIQKIIQRAQNGYPWVKVNGIFIYSVYAAPDDIYSFELFLERHADDIRKGKPNIMAGTLYAWAVKWVSRSTNLQGLIFLDGLTTMNLILINRVQLS